jgi:hypothetical protein
MKTIYPFFLLFFGFGLMAEPIKMNFESIEDFSDFSVSGMSETKTRSIFEGEAARNLRLKKYIGEDRTLELTFHDIDMAGDIQPWRNPNNADIRYIKSIYPPTLKFSYVLKDAAGATIAEGEESLRDLNFDFGITGRFRDESFKYELIMLEDWARKTLPKVSS